jgi:hypothetical protein
MMAYSLCNNGKILGIKVLVKKRYHLLLSSLWTCNELQRLRGLNILRAFKEHWNIV